MLGSLNTYKVLIQKDGEWGLTQYEIVVRAENEDYAYEYALESKELPNCRFESNWGSYEQYEVTDVIQITPSL